MSAKLLKLEVKIVESKAPVKKEIYREINLGVINRYDVAVQHCVWCKTGSVVKDMTRRSSKTLNSNTHHCTKCKQVYVSASKVD